MVGCGFICGFFGLGNGNWAWLGSSNLASIQSRVRVGPNSWDEMIATGVYPPLGNYITPVQIAPIGNSSNIERLVPWRIYADSAGIVGSLRYIRQRYLKKAVSVTSPALASSHLTDRNDMVVGINSKIVLGSNPNLAWIHQVPFDGSSTATQQNLVHIWNNNGPIS